MELYYCMVIYGPTPPRYTHRDLSLAVAEAKRLHQLYGREVQILKIIGAVHTVQVPVTRPEVEVKIFDSNQIELPFYPPC